MPAPGKPWKCQATGEEERQFFKMASRGTDRKKPEAARFFYSLHIPILHLTGKPNKKKIL